MVYVFTARLFIVHGMCNLNKKYTNKFCVSIFLYASYFMCDDVENCQFTLQCDGYHSNTNVCLCTVGIRRLFLSI